MTTSVSTRYSINGLIKTEDNVMNNLEKLCNAAGCWLTYDIYTGLWSVVINRAGASEWSFNDNNIIGGISLSGTGLDNLYNSVKVTYPHEDLRGNTDFIQIEIPTEDRYPNEPDNTLQIQYDIVTNPVQAELLGFIELKQSRVDKIIQFTTDYSKMAVRAGDVIDVTNSILGFAAKLFRVVSVNEVESSDGGIDISITALEYDADVYSEDLSRYTRTTENGIQAIGALPAPDTPNIVKYEFDVRPRVDVSTQITGGIVERVEFWYTQDVNEANDALRNYTILAIQGPANGTSFTTSETITATTDGLSSIDFYVKARAVNGSAVSPFSDPSGLIEFKNQQVTTAVTEDTQVKDNLGRLAAMMGLFALLNKLSGLFGGNSNQSAANAIRNSLTNRANTNLVGRLTVSNAAANLGLSVNNLGYGNWQIDYGGPKVNMAGSSGTSTASDAVITWTFNDGLDLDIRCRVIEPSVGQNSVDQYLGWTGNVSTTSWPTTGTPYLEWGGDNTGTGTEAVRVNLSQFKTVYPSASRMVVECRGNWYDTPGIQPIKLSGVLYTGGTTSSSGYSFTNLGSTLTRQVNSVDVYINSNDNVGGDTTLGDLIGYFIYDFASKTAQIVGDSYNTYANVDLTEPEDQDLDISEKHVYNIIDQDTSTFDTGDQAKLTARVNRTGGTMVFSDWGGSPQVSTVDDGLGYVLVTLSNAGSRTPYVEYYNPGDYPGGSAQALSFLPSFTVS